MKKTGRKMVFSGVSAGVFVLFLLTVIVGLSVYGVITTFGFSKFDAGLAAASPYLACFRVIVYCLLIINWKKVCQYLSGRNEEFYLVLMKRRKHAVALIILMELLLVYRVFLF